MQALTTGMLHRTATVLVAVILLGDAITPARMPAAEPSKGEGEKAAGKSPLAGLPGQPGPHIEKINALPDNTWLNLGSPAGDPQWGKGRGRSWSARMAYAPDLKVAFLFGEGVHCWWNKQNNRYMDDVFVYDVQGHRWVCVHPGTDVINVDLKLDANGFEVDKDGRPVPVAQLGHGYEMLTYDTDRKRFMFMPGASDEWRARAPFAEKRKNWGIPGVGLPKSNSPWLYDVRSGQWDMRKVEGPVPTSRLGMVFVYVPALKKAFFWAPPAEEVWFYDPSANTWAREKPSGTKPPFGIDPVACLDVKRERIYVGGGGYPVAKGPSAFWYYDLKTNAWVDPQPKGNPCGGDNHYGTNRAAMNYDSANDAVVLCYHLTGAQSKARGIYVYDPAANRWDAEPRPLPEGFNPTQYANCVNSFYSPECNAHFYHVAGDSSDNGVMWVYRYKKAAK